MTITVLSGFLYTCFMIVVVHVSGCMLGISSLCMCTYVQYSDLDVVIPTGVVRGVELFMTLW